MNFDVGQILIQAAATTTFAKPLVDVLKKTPFPTPAWSLPLFAIGSSIALSFLISFVIGIEISLQSASANVLAGVSAGVGAVGITELQRSTDKDMKLEKEKEDGDINKHDAE